MSDLEYRLSAVSPGQGDTGMGVCPSRQASGQPTTRQREAAYTARQRLIALLRWKTAVKRVIRVLARRRAWAEEGKALQAPWLQDLVEGLERRKGKLVRVAKAKVRPAPKRKPRHG